jgi:enoyl-CoA hydratase/carnithine racemase
MASFFSTGPTLAIGQIKLATVIGGGMSFLDGMQYEHEAVARLFASEDAREGVTAFAEKRKPSFKGK